MQTFKKKNPSQNSFGKKTIADIEEIIEEARNGRMFILADDEDRENEGDLIIPAQMSTPETINFMATYGRGLICLSLTPERIAALRLPLMSASNSSRHETAFTISIESREGVTTGISAHDRAKTISVAINPQVRSQDIATPGHVFPLISKNETSNIEKANNIYDFLKEKKIDVIIDDTEENFSSKIKKFNLIGIPYQILIGKKSQGDLLEFKEIGKETQQLSLSQIADLLIKQKSKI